MEKEVTLKAKEQRRLVALNKVVGKGWTVAQASVALGRSERQVWRLLARYREEGAVALVHGNRGQAPAHALDEQVKERVVELAQGVYSGCNQQHLTEPLSEREGITLSRSSVRRIPREAGVVTPRRRRAPRHRSRRERAAQEGMLVQIDAGTDHWLGQSRPPLALVGAVSAARGHRGLLPAASTGGEGPRHSPLALPRPPLHLPTEPVPLPEHRGATA